MNSKENSAENSYDISMVDQSKLIKVPITQGFKPLNQEYSRENTEIEILHDKDVVSLKETNSIKKSLTKKGRASKSGSKVFTAKLIDNDDHVIESPKRVNNN